MKKQETQSESGLMSEDLGDVLSRFKAWQATNGSKPEGVSNDGDTSWKLVYGQALDSINQLGGPLGSSSPDSSFIVPPPVSPTSGTPFFNAASSTSRLPEDSVTDTVSLLSRASRPSGSSDFLTPLAGPRSRETTPIRIEEAAPLRSINAAPVNTAAASASTVKPAPAPDLLYFRSTSFATKPLETAPAFASPTPAVDLPVKTSAKPARLPQARPLASASTTKRQQPANRREIAPVVEDSVAKAAMMKQKAAEACVTISAYLEQSENEVQRLRGKANDLRSDMDTVRTSVLSITQPAVAPKPVLKAGLVHTVEDAPAANVIEHAANIPTRTSTPVYEPAPVAAKTFKSRMLRLIGIDAAE